jgi:hypothetical protein
MHAATVDTRRGFRRRVRVTARSGAVAAMLEDDIHCLAVVLRHEGGRVTAVEPTFARAPWTTCPGAVAKLAETFTGLLLSEVTARRDKKQNCTHLHDMAVLAAAHAGEAGDFVYDIVATDPVGGLRLLELRYDGQLMHAWTEQDGVLMAPAEIAGARLLTLRDWIGSLSGVEQEAARLLQWSSMVAMGRTMPLEKQSDATAMPPNCYTFQPERAVTARQLGVRRDFSDGSEIPLDSLAERVLATL